VNLDYVKRVLGLEGKRAIVTGGNSGIGKGVAVSMANMGAQVAIVGRDQPTIDETVMTLKKINPDCTGNRVDISNKEEVDKFFGGYYCDNGGKLDILIANAGVCSMLRALETTEEDMDFFFNINYKGTLFCCQQAAKAMKEQKSGNIVIVTSVNALYPHPPQAAYSSTKGALEVLMQCLAVDLAPFNIRVNSLAPGAIETNIGRSNPNFARNPDKTPDKSRPRLPLGRVGEPEDMGDVVACLVSDAFRYMTGSTILVDGGLKLRNV
jgi:NAD(P)-dependent dehydrogenase (short-subunit alcohol dehydrogenase family)